MGITSEIASVIREFTEPVSEDGDINSAGELNGEFVRFSYLLCLFLSYAYLIHHQLC